MAEKERENEEGRTRRERLKRRRVVVGRGGSRSLASITSFPRLKGAGTMGRPRKVDMTESRGISRSFRMPTAKTRRETGDCEQRATGSRKVLRSVLSNVSLNDASFIKPFKIDDVDEQCLRN